MSALIGGEFEIAPSLLQGATPALITGCAPFSTGRSALRAIVEAVALDRAGATVLLPDYLCESVIGAIRDAGIPWEHYRVGSDLTVDVEHLSGMIRRIGGSMAVVVLVDYFGLGICEPLVNFLRCEHPEAIVVRDNAQSLYAGAQGRAHYSFTSLRKWLPTPDGAFVYSSEGAVPLPDDCESEFVPHKIVGNLLKGHSRSSMMRDDVYLEHSERGERILEQSGSARPRMSRASTTILANSDLHAASARRRQNYDYLASRIADLDLYPIAQMGSGCVPMVLPVRVARRDLVRGELANRRIFCPVHWPMPPSLAGKSAHGLWDSELSLVIDQRYGESDMDRLVEGLAAAAARPLQPQT